MTRLKQTLLGTPTNAFVFLSPSGKHACELWVEAGHGAFFRQCALLGDEPEFLPPRGTLILHLGI
jgi:hypothetical protein